MKDLFSKENIKEVAKDLISECVRENALIFGVVTISVKKDGKTEIGFTTDNWEIDDNCDDATLLHFRKKVEETVMSVLAEYIRKTEHEHKTHIWSVNVSKHGTSS